MPLRFPEKVAFLDGEIAGLQARIGGEGNAVQRHKMEMMTDIRDDYRKSVEAARKREEAQSDQA